MITDSLISDNYLLTRLENLSHCVDDFVPLKTVDGLVVGDCVSSLKLFEFNVNVNSQRGI